MEKDEKLLVCQNTQDGITWYDEWKCSNTKHKILKTNDSNKKKFEEEGNQIVQNDTIPEDV